jgi:hypothetical protein
VAVSAKQNACIKLVDDEGFELSKDQGPTGLQPAATLQLRRPSTENFSVARIRTSRLLRVNRTSATSAVPLPTRLLTPKNLERRTVIETVPTPWQGVVLPLYQHRSEMELRLRFERRYPLYESGVVGPWTNEAKLEHRGGFEPPRRRYKLRILGHYMTSAWSSSRESNPNLPLTKGLFYRYTTTAQNWSG